MSEKFKMRAGIALASIVIGSGLIAVSTEDFKAGLLSAGIGILLFGAALMLGLGGD